MRKRGKSPCSSADAGDALPSPQHSFGAICLTVASSSSSSHTTTSAYCHVLDAEHHLTSALRCIDDAKALVIPAPLIICCPSPPAFAAIASAVAGESQKQCGF